MTAHDPGLVDLSGRVAVVTGAAAGLGRAEAIGLARSGAKVVVNEMTTVASVWTHAQFIDGAAIKGNALGLRIAAGNVPSFVDLATGGWGGVVIDPLNGGETPTMANFASLADVLSGCATPPPDEREAGLPPTQARQLVVLLCPSTKKY